MKKVFYTLSVLSCALFLSCGNGQQEKPAADTPATGKTAELPASAGKTLFEENCKACHGSDGKSGIMGASDLSASTINHDAVVSVIKYGRNGMAPYGTNFTAAQIEALAKYAESLRK